MGKRERSSYKRERRREFHLRNDYPFFLIVCEDRVQSPDYFRSFPYYRQRGDTNKFGNPYPDSAVRIISGAGQHYTVIEKAKEEFDRLKKELGSDAVNPQDVWCVLDCDDNGFGEYDKLCRAIDLAKRYGFNPIYSIQCFELWYVLHFQRLESALDRTQYDDIISRELDIKYEHGMTGMYFLLENKQGIALKHANNIYKDKEFNKKAREDPITTVHFLVEGLNQAFEQIKDKIKR